MFALVVDSPEKKIRYEWGWGGLVILVVFNV